MSKLTREEAIANYQHWLAGRFVGLFNEKEKEVFALLCRPLTPADCLECPEVRELVDDCIALTDSGRFLEHSGMSAADSYGIDDAVEPFRAITKESNVL